MGAPVTAIPRAALAPAAPWRARRWWADAAGSAAIASVLVVTALWTAHGGIQQLDATDGGLTSLGRLAGLLSADLMLLQVLMMARIPWVERSYGQDALARRHRWFGFASFWLLVFHLVATTAGYAATGGLGIVGQLWDLVADYPGMLLAAGGTAAIVLVVVTSVRAARRAMRYESWHLLHLYAYLGLALALPHQLWTGADFVATPWARAYWWTLYLVAAAAVLLFRVGLPLWRTMRHRLVVDAVVPESPGVVSVHLRGRDLHRLPARPGQFLLWRFLDGPGWTRANPYSLSAGPLPDRLRITVKDLGDGSARLARLRPGTRVAVEGPYGVMTGTADPARPVLMLAAGIGVTVMRALLDDPDLAGRHVTLLHRVRTPGEAVFAAELADLAARRPLYVATLPGPRPRHPSFLPAHLATGADADADVLRRMVPHVRDCDVYLCGPQQWMHAARRALAAAGTPADRIHAEQFAW
ncbi:oxidoreductase [Catellatospora sp. TT07R-123]|uniref:ferredoxin reductase family protein n=1 Tax=Catellatospora sp. TT07R-123 TaxID=2733863 RepID=UPI001B24B2B3|nr:ferredoxin reductase family protein [Catellatospora sp. TT07R-123]GHJ48306.1 oxidoreductase [Catellatospora sp. TT07R-123]